MGNQALNPVISGAGGGFVHTTYLVPPLWALCDELGIDRANFPIETKVGTACNNFNTSCISFVGHINSNYKGSSPAQNRYPGSANESIDSTLSENLTHNENQGKMFTLTESQRIKLIQDTNFDKTLLMFGVESGEGYE